MTVHSSPDRIKIKRFDAIDGLRAYACIGIVLMHVLANITPKPDSNILTTSIIPWFTDFTLLFMIVSGFSVSYGYFDKIKSGSITPIQFYRKRYIRLLPFYALLCLLDLALSPSWRSVAEAFADITLTNGMIPDVEINVIGVGWFMGVVMLYYVFFPFVVFLQDTKRKALITFVCSIILVWIGLQYAGSESSLNRRYILYCLPLFLSGGLVYLYIDKIRQLSRLGHYTLLMLSAALTILPFVILRNEFNTLISSLAVFSLWTIFAISCSQHSLKWSPLSNKATRYVASISLEIYLCHMVIYRVVEKCGLDRYIDNPNLLYILTSAIVISGAIVFSHIVKFHILDPLINKYVK
ncbi:MAG: acyltransferase [Paramuribaculum sp.]|nr:acyltransferase [Paramuribaculum sp.]